MPTQHELDFLEGATVVRVTDGEIGPAFTFKLAEPVIVPNVGETDEMTFEIWQDPEGNGPGEFALVRA